MKKEQIKTQPAISREALAWCLAAQSFCIAPLFFYFPFWVPVLWLIASLWRVQIYRGHWGHPPSLVKMILGLGCIGGLWVTYRGGFGVAPVVAFLVCAFVLKLLEARTRKDVVIVLYVCFIAVGAQLLFSQTIFAALYAVLSIVLVIAAFTAVFGLQVKPLRERLFFASKLTLQAFPLAIILFLVLPRMGQLWAVPLNNASGKTGFSDSMSPGDISELIRSSAVAFRASFALSDGAGSVDSVPPPKDRYWRGLVLEEYDGSRWQRSGFQRISDFSRARDQQTVDDITAKGDSIEYSILLEPHQQRWLFTLMAPLAVVDSTVSVGFKSQALLTANLPVSQRIQYKVRSTSQYLFEPRPLSLEAAKLALQLPNNGNPRAKGLVAEWLKDDPSPRGVIEKALGLYRDDFYYTLNPPTLGANGIDDFIFITKRGFCEHFSSSFVYLMRLANIPARVVVGYQGGELNVNENYLVVRQSDAHAWAEVWLEGEGWVRVDPTSVVAPNRIESGLYGAVDDGEAEALAGAYTKKFAFLGRLQMRMDSISYLWHSQVLAYDSEKQKGLFKRLLGGTDYWRIALALIGSVAVLLAFYFLLPLMQGRQFVAIEVKLFNKFEKKLCKYGYTRLKGETPAQFVSRVAELNPSLKKELLGVRDVFYAIAYGPSGGGSKKTVNQFVKTLNGFPYKKLNPV